MAPKLHFSASVTFSTIWDVLAFKGRTENPGFVWGWECVVRAVLCILEDGLQVWACPPAAMRHPRAKKTSKGEATGHRDVTLLRLSILTVTDCNARRSLTGDGTWTRERTHLDQMEGDTALGSDSFLRVPTSSLYQVTIPVTLWEQQAFFPSNRGSHTCFPFLQFRDLFSPPPSILAAC